MRRFARVLGLVLLLTVASIALVGCQERSADLPEPESLAGEETTSVVIYYASGRSLVEESRVVSLEHAYEEVLDEILEAQPEVVTDIAIVQPVATYRSVTLDEDGVLTIDWDREVLDFEATPEEKRIALAGILYSLGQFPEVEKVRFTVEGQVDGEIDGKDVEDFWLDVSLIGQPWDSIRQPAGDEPTTAVEPDGAETGDS